MSHEHFHSLDEMVNFRTASMVDKCLKNPEHYASIKYDILSELSDNIRAMAAVHRRVTPDKFLVRPSMLSDGSCLALLDFDIPNTSNAFKLIASDILSKTYHVSVIQENANQLSKSVSFKLSHEQAEEVQRQLKVLKVGCDGSEYKSPAVFTLIYSSSKIDGYEYEVVQSDSSNDAVKSESSSEQSSNVVQSAGLLFNEQNENTSVRRGPTPAQTSYELDVKQDGQVTTVSRKVVGE